MNASIVVLGAILLLTGALAYGYTVTETNRYFFGAFTETNAYKPYGVWALPLLIAGLILLIAGAMIPERTIIKTTHVHRPVERDREVRVKKTVVREEE